MLSATTVLRRQLQDIALRRGLWITSLDPFQREIARLYYRRGGFVFVQVGANDGVSFDDLYWLVKRFQGRGLVIEPMHDAFERLQHNYRSLPNVKAVRTAVHPTDSTVDLYRVRHSSVTDVPAWVYGSASLDPHWLEHVGVDSNIIERETVPANTLMQLLTEYDALDCDVLQIDAEGCDLDILDMLDFRRTNPHIIKYESLAGRIPDPQSREDIMQQSLRGRGYSITVHGMDVVAVRQS